MKLSPQSPLVMLCLIFTVITLFSCSKDSDLMADYVALDPDIGTIAKFVANDSYQISISNNPEDDTFEITVNSGSGSADNAGSGGTDNGESGGAVNDSYQISTSLSIILDVLANDTFDNLENVSIIDTSQPNNGNVIINSDNTLTYTPSTIETSENTFTYTAEFVNEDGTVGKETATVRITITPSTLREGQVNFSAYGAVGDGVTDDTAAIQNAFDNETDLIADAGKTFLVSGQIQIDQNSTQTIDFNGSKITRKTPVGYMLWIDKSSFAGTNTSISNLDLDGNELNGSLLYIESRTQLTNVKVYDAINNVASGGIRGIYISIKNEPGVSGEWVFDNVNIDWIASNATKTGGITTGGSGYATGIHIHWPVTVTNGIQFVYKNSTLSNSYGIEGDLMILNTPNNDISFTNNTLWFENMTFRDFQRRAAKVFLGNTTWINCDFYAASANNPAIDTSAGSAGIFRLGAGSAALGSQNHLICGSNFYGNTTDPLDSWETTVMVGGQTGLTSAEFRHCTFNGDDPANGNNNFTGIWFFYDINDFKFCDCDFNLASTTARGSKIVKAANTVFVGADMQMDSNNTYANGQTAALAGVNTYYEVVDLSGDCDACPSIDD